MTVINTLRYRTPKLGCVHTSITVRTLNNKRMYKTHTFVFEDKHVRWEWVSDCGARASKTYDSFLFESIARFVTELRREGRAMWGNNEYTLL